MSLLSKLVQYPKHTVCVGVLQKAGELEQYRMRLRALNTAVSHANRFALYCELNGGKMQELLELQQAAHTEANLPGDPPTVDNFVAKLVAKPDDNPVLAAMLKAYVEQQKEEDSIMAQTKKDRRQQLQRARSQQKQQKAIQQKQ